MDLANRQPDQRVVLLRDGRWPDAPGVCCWRHNLRAALTTAGFTVSEATWQPPKPRPAGEAAAPVPPRRLGWLSPTLRQPLVKVYRKSRQAARRLRPGAPPPTPLPGPQELPGLAGATLVVAESLRAATVAVKRGTPGSKIWALALPAESTPQGASSKFGKLLAAVAPTVGGLLTDSELAREAVERAAATSRPQVVLFPPLAIDRTCPSCVDVPATVQPTSSATAGADVPDGTEQPAEPPETDPAVEQLGFWRQLLESVRAGGDQAVPYSFPAARLRGLSAEWAPAPRLDWAQESNASPVVGPADIADAAMAGWTTAAQQRGIRTMLDAALPRAPRSPRACRATLISGFDLKFVRELGQRLDDRTDLDVTLDEWPAVSRCSDETEAYFEGAESILAEWARPNAAWFAERKRPDQILVVRLHRFELETSYPRQIDMDKVDAVVHVSPPIGQRIRAELGWPMEKVLYIPNFIDIDWVDRPKLPDARFGIGFVGMEWMNKRFDLALDLLAEVRRQDPRFTLFVRSVAPWDNKYAWPRPEEREYVGWCQERLERDPLLRGAVVFDAPGRDMGRWYRRVGNVLSMSDVESFHMAAAEGMASGAVPVIRPWPGAREIYDKEWIYDSVGEAATSVLANADPEVWARRATRARTEIRAKVDPSAVVDAWADLLHGNIERAREYFGGYAAR